MGRSGGMVCLLSSHAQRVGDHAANTIVIKQQKVVEPNLDLLLEQSLYNSLHTYPHLEARLRQQVTPYEAALALDALMRRDELTSDARIGLFHEMATYLKQKVVFPDTALHGVSDEQYVRIVVEVLFQTEKDRA